MAAPFALEKQIIEGFVKLVDFFSDESMSARAKKEIETIDQLNKRLEQVTEAENLDKWMKQAKQTEIDAREAARVLSENASGVVKEAEAAAQRILNEANSLSQTTKRHLDVAKKQLSDREKKIEAKESSISSMEDQLQKWETQLSEKSVGLEKRELNIAKREDAARVFVEGIE